MAKITSLSDQQKLTLAQFDSLPDSAKVDVKIVAMVKGVSVATVWRMVERKQIPAPVREGKRCTRWRVSDVRGGANDEEKQAA